MIIFYNKLTGKIEGTIEGRIHDKFHLNMWVGSKKDNDRIICDWEKVGEDEKTFTFEPNHPQKDIFISLEKGETKLSNYKVNPETKRLELKE